MIVAAGGCNNSAPSSDNGPAAKNSSIVDVKPGAKTKTTDEGIVLKEKAPGLYQDQLLLDDDTVFRYTMHIPESYDGKSEVPLVFCLHFGGRVTPYFGQTILTGLVEPALRDLNAIIVSPDSINGRWSTPENESAVVQLFHAVANSYQVDRTKTLITGYSLGGHGTWAIGGKHQDLFKAAIPIAGRPTDLLDWSTPLYVIHSTKDDVVPFKPAKTHVENLKDAGADVELVVIDDLTHYQTPLYGKYLNQAVPWIQKAWAKSKND